MVSDSAPTPSAAGAGRPWIALAALIALGLAARLAFIWSGISDRGVLADDAFYYFTIARNVVTGLGSTFDGLAPTNGYHPLYLVTLLPVFLIGEKLRLGAWIPVHLALSLCAAFEALAATLIFSAVRRLFTTRAALTAAALWLLCPLPMFLGLRGLETSLSTCVLAGWLALAAPALARGRLERARAIALGALLGLLGLARADLGPLAGLLAVVFFAPWRSRAAGEWRRATGLLGLMAVVAMAVASPWLLWNQHAFGSPWPVSGLVKLGNAKIFGHLPTATRLTPGTIAKSLLAPLWVPLGWMLGEEFTPLRVTRPVVAGVLLALVLAAIGAMQVLRRTPGAGRARFLGGLLALVAAHALAYAFVLRHYMTWYAQVPALAACLVGGVAAERLAPRGRVALALLAAVLFFAAGARFVAHFGRHPGGLEAPIHTLFARIEAKAPRARVVGVYNAGALGYFAPRRDGWHLVNLDGVVNNAIYLAGRQHRVYDYITTTCDVLLLSPGGLEPRGGMTPAQFAELTRRYPRWPDAEQVPGVGPEICGPRLPAFSP